MTYGLYRRRGESTSAFAASAAGSRFIRCRAPAGSDRRAVRRSGGARRPDCRFSSCRPPFRSIAAGRSMPGGRKTMRGCEKKCRAAAEGNEPPGRAARSADAGLSRRRCCFRADNTWCFILRSFLRRACGASGLLTKHFRLSIRYYTEGRRVNRRRDAAAFFEKFCLTIAALRGSMLLQNKEGRRIRSHPQRSEGVNKRSEKRVRFFALIVAGAVSHPFFLCKFPNLGVLRY